MKEFIYIIGAITFSAFLWKELDLKFVEYKIPEPYFIVKTYEVNTCMDASGKTHVTKTVEQVKVDMEN